MLDDPSPQVRFTAAVAVGDAEYKAARPALRQLRQDKDSNVSLAAEYALDKLGSGEAIPVLKEATDSNSQIIRANAVLLLGKLGKKKALPILYETLRDEDSEMEVRFQAVEAIARLGDVKVYEKIWTMLISAYADDRVRGIKAMGALGTSRAEDAISTMLKDPVLEVRLAAAGELGKLGNKSGENIVLQAFRKNQFDELDRNRPQTARVMATLAIGRLCSNQLRPFLSRMLNNPSAAIRLAAAKSALLCANR
jgi:HEAT repeat protein